MSVKLSPKYALIHLDSSLMTLNMPVINLYIEEESRSLNENIKVVKKATKSDSYNLF